uniref:protein-tyrosine-phosphatase n=1 Tax=Hemiselmis andersenii TaxID=464988 RepID=A0A6U4KCZ2_HEMAN|mmetsp:Transcript_39500/g.92421  ORF Transcript_39500/g.92421 Transcript_39500/m.92421 type:complete len:540 (-) Transcript_39500:254-1873(-)
MVADIAHKLRKALTPGRRGAPETNRTPAMDTTSELHADDVGGSKQTQGIPPLAGEGRSAPKAQGGKGCAEEQGAGGGHMLAPTRPGASEAPLESKVQRGGSGTSVVGEGTDKMLRERHDWKTGHTLPLIPGRLSFGVHTSDAQTKSEIKKHPALFFFSSDFQERYEPFCADFGPVNLGIVHSFCGMMRGFMTDKRILSREIVYYTSSAPNFCTNAAFLLSSYLVVEHGRTPEDAWAPFETMLDSPVCPFRDASFLPDSYKLTVLSCLGGLKRAMSLGWYDPANFDLEEYDYLDNPKHADMHFLSPKMTAFRGPSNHTRQVMPGVYTFSPRHYAQLFAELDVTGVVRLNEASTYRRSAFIECGFDHLDLYFDDCTVPDNSVIQRFVDFCEGQGGTVAVHCKAGLGRTGTLIGVWFMMKFGFTAAEVIGWMRIVRPGCVIGPQQQYLHWAEKQLVAEPNGGGLRWKPTEEPQDADSYIFDTSLSAEMGEAVSRAQNVRAGVRVGEMMPVKEQQEEEDSAEECMFRAAMEGRQNGHACDVKG